MLLPAAFFFLSTLSGSYAAIGPAATLDIVNKVIAPDGFTRSTVLAGGTFPGPLITGNKGANFQLNVVDQLTDSTMLKSTSIHWHGFFQAGTNYDDGPAFVTQCPITPNNSFLYDFNVPHDNFSVSIVFVDIPPGTFWYHSHLSTQYCDGLRGPFVVYDPADPQKDLYGHSSLPESTIITLADWYHIPAPSVPRPPVFDSTLINGLGRYAGGPLSPLAVINVVQGKRYRFRMVSISCDPNWIFSIDGHKMTIIEVDSVNHQPLTVDSIQIFAGQRYSFVLTADQTIGNYWVRAQPTLPGSNQGFVNGTNSAILRYATAPVRDPMTNSTITQPLVETALHPLVKSPVPGAPYPGGADVNLNLNITFTGGRFEINGTSFVPPTAPVLLQILSGTHSAQELLPKGSVIELPPNQVIEVSIPGGSTGAPHPFHLHGHNFFVIRSAGNSTYNFDNPVIRDVVSTGPALTDLTTFRFVTDNAGPWFLHCHIDWHLDIGLAIVFAENIPAIAEENPPPAWDQLCPIYDASAQD
ncbi:laccase 1 precursor [Mycena latifolia]|nr:laccase 1 precursor [Mycena latifolia]